MLIKALCDYYDMLDSEGKVVSDGYSKVKVHYLVCLNPDGSIDEIVNWQDRETIRSANGKAKEKLVPREVIMPKRTEKTSIKTNIIEHRPLYIFGLNYDGKQFVHTDKTKKAEKSHTAFKGANLSFIEGLHSPLINAYRAFLKTWVPENETQNPYLLSLGKSYKNAYFVFCLSGYPNMLLHNERLIKDRWEKQVEAMKRAPDAVVAQCAITGREEPIARIHNNLKGIYGGLASGSVFIGYKNSAGCSYGNKQSYNSNISETAMNKYTEAFNYLLDGKRHKSLVDDMTVVYWATGGTKNEICSDIMSCIVFGENDLMYAKETDEMLEKLIESVREGDITDCRISGVDKIDENVDFYIVGVKPNSSRVAVKFIYHRKFGEILTNIALHQSDMQIKERVKPIPLWRLKRELISPKSSNERVGASLLAEMFKAIIYGSNYPNYLLSTIIRRVKTDKTINSVRAGVIKACINRNLRLSGQKEEIKLALDYNNKNQAYLCGRLFAVLENLQQAASNNSLNRTIRDTYFSSASSKPALVFPKLLSLAQNHLKKVKNPERYNDLIQLIIRGIDSEFPETLMLSEQGKFMIGYYHQKVSLPSENNTDKRNADKNNITKEKI